MQVNPAVQFAIVVAILLIVLYAIYRRVPISLRGGPVQFKVSLDKQVEDIKTELAVISEAVNGVPKGSPHLVDRVQSVEALAHWSATAIHAIATHVGLNLPEPPDRRITRVEQ